MEKQLIWLVLGVALALLFVSWSRDKWTRHQRRAVARRAQSGENRAEKLLAQRGYTILDAQVRRPVVMSVDGKRVESFIKADYLVRKDGRDFLVEVKTGKQANVRLPNVRRQLFEYQNIFQTDGILFIDMNKYDIIEVAFDDPATSALPLKSFLSGLLVGVLLVVFIYSYQ